MAAQIQAWIPLAIAANILLKLETRANAPTLAHFETKRAQVFKTAHRRRKTRIGAEGQSLFKNTCLPVVL
jgi:hypothetical protein